MMPRQEATKVYLRRDLVSLTMTEGVNVCQNNSRMTKVTE